MDRTEKRGWLECWLCGIGTKVTVVGIFKVILRLVIVGEGGRV